MIYILYQADINLETYKNRNRQLKRQKECIIDGSGIVQRNREIERFKRNVLSNIPM